MAGNECHELEILLQSLQSVSPNSSDQDPEKAKDIVIDISELLSTELSSVQHGKCLFAFN